MASLVEELITTLNQENEIYESLIPINEKKTKIIINNDLEALQEITKTEQEMIQKISALEAKRQEVIINIGTVINRNPGTLTLKNLIRLLEKQPKEQEQLSIIHDKLQKTVHRLTEINHQNQSLIEQSLEMIEFNMNFIQSTRMSPGNNYNKDASGIEMQVEQTRRFDAKQ